MTTSKFIVCKFFSVVFLFFSTFNCISQNLINNGDFEQFDKCPTDISQLKRAIGWRSPSDGTSDYFNVCSEKTWVSIPKNNFGSSFPASGNAYAGFGAYQYGKEIAYEFIQSKLTTKLKKDSLYTLSFFVKRPTSSNLVYSSLSCLFTETDFEIFGREFWDKELIKNATIVVNEGITNKTVDWQKIESTFKAKGNEEYITIGFGEIKKVKVLSKSKLSKENKSYYYIDDIRLSMSKPLLIKKENEIKVETIVASTQLSEYDEALTKNIVLKNIVFESNKSALLPESFKELDKLLQYLKSNSKKIELYGYTDNTGKEADNLSLSDARAKAVANYFIKNGIDSTRISAKGYGSSNPLFTNDTEQNKLQNRRVEFILKD